MKRPSENLLNEFYELAELNEENRLMAVERFLDNKEFFAHKNYVLERLIQGLASSRAGSRLGFSTLLALILKEYHTKISIDEIFKIVDEKLDLTKPDSSNSAIGQHLVYLSIISSEAYNKSITKVLQREHDLMSQFAFLKYTVTQSILDMCLGMQEEVFSTKIYPILKEKLCKKLSQMGPDEFLLLLGVKDRFKEILTNDTQLVKKSGKFHLKEAHYAIFIEKLKNTEPVGRLHIALAILKVGRENGKFSEVYQEILEKYAIEGDEIKSIERYLNLAKDLISSEEVLPKEIPTIFSENLITYLRKYAHRSDPKFRFVHPLIESVLTTAENRFIVPDFPKSIILQILELLDSIDGGNFDTKIGISSKKFTEILIGQLDEKSMKKLLPKIFLHDSWSIHRCISVFPQLSAKIKIELLVKTARFEPKSEGYFNVLCAFIEAMFDVKFFHKKFSTVVVKNEDKEVITEVANQMGIRVEVGEEFSSLSLVPIILYLLSSAATQPEYVDQYKKDAEEAELCLKSVNIGVIIDLLISILTRRQKVHKALVYYAFYSIHDKLKRTHVKQILEVISKSDEEISGEVDLEEADDDDFEPITEKELRAVRKKKKIETFNGEEEEEDEPESEAVSDSGEDEDNEEIVVDPNLLRDVKKALGKAALPTDVKEVDDDMDLDDEALLKLDEALSTAFRGHTATYKRLLKEDAKIFRAKLFDLITIYFSLAPVEKLLTLLPYLLELSATCVKTKNPEISAKISSLITNLSSQKKEIVQEKTILKCLNKIKILADDLESHEARIVAGKIVAFLFHLSISAEPGFSKQISGWLDILLNSYMVEAEKHSMYGDILAAVFQKYPDRLVNYLPSLVEYAFNTNIGYQKKIDALQYASSFMRKDLKRSTVPKITDKFFIAAKTLSADIHRLLDTLQNKFAKEDKLQKRHLAKALQFLSNFAHSAGNLYENILQKSMPTNNLDELLKLLKPLESIMQKECDGIKFENFIKRLHQRLF